VKASGSLWMSQHRESNRVAPCEVSCPGLSQDVILRGSVGFTVRIFGPHALGIQYLVTSRNTGAPDLRDRHQSVQTVTVSYNFLGHTRFGAVEWRPDQ
jgi:hypothetical protein